MKNGVFWDVTPRGSCKKSWFLQEPHGITSQKTQFFIVTAVKTSILHIMNALLLQQFINVLQEYYKEQNINIKEIFYHIYLQHQ
jgi:hypothetical protein